MSNNYFQFKQFIVQQEKSTLKVTTDSCIFGAWIAKKINNYISNNSLVINSCLDVGTGTGLLMLMLAQQFTGTIHGIEIDKEAYEQALLNINSSHWNNRLHLFNADVIAFSLPQRYDFIISNPPFFEHHLPSANKKNNLAKHSNGLTLSALVAVIKKHLTDNGHFAILLPYSRMNYFIQMAETVNLYVKDMLLIKQSEQHDYFRCILLFSRNKQERKNENLIIRENNNSYTVEFTNLLKEYYLYL